MIERLPEPAKTPAMRPSWPERDQTAVAPLSVEHSHLRPFSRSVVRAGEHRIPVHIRNALQRRRFWAGSARSFRKKGERCAMTTVHCAVHRFVHANVIANLQNHNEMHSDKTVQSDGVWLGVGLERPRYHCHEMPGGRSSPISEVTREVMWPSPYYFTLAASRCTSPCIGRQILTCDRIQIFRTGISTRPDRGGGGSDPL